MRFPLTYPAWGILGLLSLSPSIVAQDTGTGTGTAPAPAPTASSRSSAQQVMNDNGAGLYARLLGINAPGSLNEGGGGTHFAVSDDSFDSDQAKRFAALMARQENQESQYLYQSSQNVIDAASLRGLTGKIVQTRNTNANLGGRAQSVLSTGEREPLSQGNSPCNGSSPISLFSGLGATVTILKEDIPFDGGVIHITDG
jgi:hypothetical protein